MLLLDRYLRTATACIDLATGRAVRIRRRDHPVARCPDQRSGRWSLLDADRTPSGAWVEAWTMAVPGCAEAPASLHGVEEALIDARDGRPRRIDLMLDGHVEWCSAVNEVARSARRCGFVPIDVDVLGDLLRRHGSRWPSWLVDRSMVILVGHGAVSRAAADALLRLAERDARPHLVVTGLTCGLGPAPRLVPLPCTVHDGDGADGDGQSQAASAEELSDRAWSRAEAGATDDASLAAARWAVILSPSTASEVTARAAVAVTLTRMGRSLEARAALAPASAREPDLSPETARRLCEAREALAAMEVRAARGSVWTGDFLQIVEICQGVEDEAITLGQVLGFLRDRLGAASLAMLVDAQRQLRIVAQLGSVPREPRGVLEVLDGAPASVPLDRDRPAEGVWPIRYAGVVRGALWMRWPAGLSVLASDLAPLMALTASAVSPALHAVAERDRACASSAAMPDLVGDSDAMQTLKEALLRAARSPFPVLIEGESGSGKELVARAIHRASVRRERPFSALNCAALADELAEAELFGHAKGAFTGAIAERAGLFEQASGGTLFLDEVSELSSAVQAKLLRVLQEQEVRRLGEMHVRRIDTRIVAATNKPLAAEVQAGRFRRDLRYRLDVVRLSIPPLRERLEDVPSIVRHVWNELSRKTGSRAVLSPSALATLGRYDWPGNVRELQNVLASLMVASPPRGLVHARHLPEHVLRSSAVAGRGSLASARREFEMRFVRAALARAGGRRGAAARDLGLSRQGLRKLVTRLGLDGQDGACGQATA